MRLSPLKKVACSVDEAQGEVTKRHESAQAKLLESKNEIEMFSQIFGLISTAITRTVMIMIHSTTV